MTSAPSLHQHSAHQAHDARRRMLRRRRRTVGALVSLLLVAALGLAGYTAAVALAPLPALEVEISPGIEAETRFAADATGADAAVAAKYLPTAIGWRDGEQVWANDDTPYPLGSVSKLITVLVCLDAQPLEPGADGPTYTWTEYDRERQDFYLSLQGVAYPIPVGTEITLRQMLTFIFLPSSNDYAEAYANWVFDSNEAFLAAVEEFKAKHGLTSLTMVEPTGMDDLNRASAADLVRVARVALANDTVREFNGMKSAVMPWGVGLIENTNPLLGELPGVVGVKTGMLSTVGYNLVLAEEADAFGRPITNISVTLARPTKEDRAQSGRDMLRAMAGLPQQVPLTTDGEVVGTVATWQGDQVQLITQGTAQAVLVPGEEAVRTLAAGSVGEAAADDAVGEWIITAPTGEQRVPVITTAPIEEPDLWWRLTNPDEVFGWG